MSHPRPRPLSPHLQIYRPQLTSVLSFMHRATGAFLAASSIILVYWLMALAAGPEAFARAQALLHSPLGASLLLFISLALFYHLSTGIRHLLWDTGYGLDLKRAYLSGKIAVISAALLTLVFWAIILI